MVVISASLLSCNFARFEEEIRAVEAAGTDWIHVDVMDGHFVPNITIGPPIVKALKKVATKPFDVHVMIDEPLRYADDFMDAGADLYVFHVEAKDDPWKVIEKVRARDGIKVGITVSPDTPLDRIEPYLTDVDMVLVMSVYPGFPAQKFIEESLDRVRSLRVDYGFGGYIELDGGIKVHNAGKVAEAGVNVLVSGSGIFKTDDLRGTISRLRSEADIAFERAGWATKI